MNIPDLLPCPFCGGEPRGWRDTNCRAFCPSCNCTTPWKASMAMVIQAWNTREGRDALPPACPFCGGQARIQRAYRRGNLRAICRDCGCATAWSRQSVNDVWKIWNRRTEE